MESIPLYTPRTTQTMSDEKNRRKYINGLWNKFKTMKKTTHLCNCLAYPLFLLCKDVHMATRSQWDTTVDYYDEISETKGMVVTNTRVTWSRSNIEQQSYAVISYDPTNDNDVVIYWIKQLNQLDQCHVETTESMGRLKFLERVVTGKGEEALENMYQDWNCNSCKLSNVCTALVCVHCFVARWWRCSDETCECPQLQNATECYKCKTKKKE